MSEPSRPFVWPYDRTPGGPNPPPTTTREEGQEDLWSFTALSLLSTAIIAVAGLSAWFMVH